MIRLLKKYKNIFAIIIILILIIGSVCIRKTLEESNEEYEDVTIVKEETKEIEELPETNEIKNIYVDIKGAINNPGVYEIENDKRIIDVVNLAGGLREDANTSFINLAKKLEDSMVIIIYTDEEIEKAKTEDNITYIIDNTCICPSISNDACIDNNIKNKEEVSTDNSNNETSNTSSTTNIISDKININTASIIDLQTLPGIGESKAKSIIDYRDNEGAFSTIEDIKKVSGIGDNLYEKIKEYITV